MTNSYFSRREFACSLAAGLGSLAAASAAAQDRNESTSIASEIEEAPSRRVIRNSSSFRSKQWHPYFSSLRNGAILVDIDSRSLNYWSEDESVFLLYPTSVPISPELTKLGRTSVVRKVEGPSWRPTPSMLERNPDWPVYIPPGPENPLGTHALYLSWQFYRIHGTHDTRKIGRKSSDGCIGLYNEHIAELFSHAKVGTQVLLI
ncbi:MAG: L,D-transpeptidase [Albidovulum sp.]|nr:L,D-transpeptidase [Albidovulum sp.]MDE0531017.1 L,D-transpeptidase [Albidovulum sp.]